MAFRSKLLASFSEAAKFFLAFAALLMFTFSSSAIENNKHKCDGKPNHRKYTISQAFNKQEQGLINAAAAHIEEKISCVCFEFVEEAEDSPGVLKVYFMLSPVGGDGFSYVGFFSRSENYILLTDKRMGADGLLRPMDNDFFYKVAIHEFGHWLGVPNEHAFDRSISDESQFTPVISDKSQPRLYEKDIDFLKNLVCNK